MMREICCFDVLSHANMHLPFNETYLRVLMAAFPNARIRFFATAGHVDNLARRFAEPVPVDFEPFDAFAVPWGFSRHNPLFGGLAAKRVLQSMSARLASVRPDLVVMGGVDANLFGALCARWPAISEAPLHMLLHSHLGDAMRWRSRNPLIRGYDFISRLRGSMPSSVTLVALDLGVREAILEMAPHLAGRVTELEHPVPTAEWSDDTAREGPLRVGFLGMASSAKGFPLFCDIARQWAGPHLEFHGIGIAGYSADNGPDIGALASLPVADGLPRAEYLKRLRTMDLICLPLHGRTYDFVASGSVCDAITALKPVVSFRTRTLAAMHEKYGPIGMLADSEEAMVGFFRGLTRAGFAKTHADWVANLVRIRAARAPEALGAAYAEMTFRAAPQVS
jgi:hypothetical protein